MTTKVSTTVLEDDDTEMSPGSETDDKSPADDKADKAKGKVRDDSTPPLREIRIAEDASLKQVLDGLGSEGSFRIAVSRLEPEDWLDPQTGRRVKTAGKLKTYLTKIDEDFISDRHGGGKYQLRFMRRTPKGSYEFFTQRTVDIAGDPRVDDVPRTTMQGATAAPTVVTAGEHPSLVKEAFGVLKEQLERAGESREAAPRGVDPAIQVVLDQMRRDAERRDREIDQMRAELAQARSAKPEPDPIKDKLLGSLIDGQSGHVEALKLRQESELRQLKEAAVEDQRRRDDRHERDVAAMRQGYERELVALRASHQSEVTIMTQSHNLQVKLLETDNRRLERDIGELRSEVKDLRSRKDKTIVETAKELEAVKDALGLDGDSDKSNFDKFMEVATSPAAAEFLSRVVGNDKTAAGVATVPGSAPANPAPAQGRQLVQSPDGQKFWQVPDGKGGTRLIPAKKKPKVIPATVNPDGTVATPAIELPEVDPAAVAMVVGYLERAFAARQEPQIVAQSGRTSVPEEILTWIRANDSDTVSGVDLFMSKVARLPSTSPLSSQAGKNWLRKVGKELVGE